MWIKKFHRDQTEDKRSPIPTQVVSNEEFLPTPQINTGMRKGEFLFNNPKFNRSQISE